MKGNNSFSPEGRLVSCCLYGEGLIQSEIVGLIEKDNMHKYFFILLSSFSILMLFSTPDVNTGDAGELVTASYFMGIAHPSGYPLYLLFSKALSLIPIGNIAFRMALGSVFFSSLSLVVLYWMVLKTTGREIASLFSVALLLSSQCFLTQSVIIKFYPLNLFLILCVVAIWQMLFLLEPCRGQADTSIRPGEERGLFLVAFLFGLIASHHHLGVIISGPVLLSWFLFFPKHLRFTKLCRSAGGRKVISIMIFLAFAGGTINLYLFIRGGNYFYNVFTVESLSDLLSHMSRQAYGEIGTVSLAKKSVTSGFSTVVDGCINFFLIIMKNFTWLAFVLLVPGLIFLWQASWKMCLFLLASLILYGPFLALLCFNDSPMSDWEYYIYAQQYFLPGLAFFSVLAGNGVHQLLSWCEKFDKKIAAKILIIALLFIPVHSMGSRTLDSNYRKNYVPYQIAKDANSILPINSLYIASGDNEKFQGRYLKLIGRYREDVCLVNAVWLQESAIGTASCEDVSYGSMTPSLLAEEGEVLRPLASEGRLFSNISFSNEFPIQESFKARKFSFLYSLDDNSELVSSNTNEETYQLNRRLEQADRVVGAQVCEGVDSEDMFTNYLCGKYRVHHQEMIRYYCEKPKAKTNADKGM